MKQLVLGSNSPRRKEILSNLGFTFIGRASNIDESVPAHVQINQVSEYLAIQKNRAIPKTNDEVVLTADTIVVLNDEILGKPENHEHAFKMLTKLSGKSHQVITGVCISSDERIVSFSKTTVVRFNDLKATQINHYIEQYRPYDKAGAYGIQEWIGLVAINKLQGSYHNVVGLPSDKVYDELVNNFEIMPLF
jgi:septum formation protein